MRTKLVFTGGLAGKTKLVRNKYLFKNGVCDISDLSDEDQKAITHYMTVCYQVQIQREAGPGEVVMVREAVVNETEAPRVVSGDRGTGRKAAEEPAPVAAVDAGTADAVTAGSGNAGQRSGAAPRH